MIRKLDGFSEGRRSYGCTICGRVVRYEPPLPRQYPFCSERCQMVDLGRWLQEEYTIDRHVTPEDLGESPQFEG